jgi:hypothetical protein
MGSRINRFENPFDDERYLSTLKPIIILSLVKSLVQTYFFYLDETDIITISTINLNL